MSASVEPSRMRTQRVYLRLERRRAAGERVECHRRSEIGGRQ
jgi:hypothetical protein